MVKAIVGETKITCPKSKKERLYRYSDVPTVEGWVSVDDYLPIPYDLMYLKIDRSLKTKSGWWTGLLWKGLRLKPKEKVIMWKRNHEFEA